MKIAAPEDAEGELATFRPHLLVHNDNDRLGPKDVAGILCRVEVQYSDGMDAEISVDGEFSIARDMSTEELLQLVDRVTGFTDRGSG